MNTLHIAGKDLRIFLKDRGAVALSIIMPLVFVVVFSGALTALAGGTEEEDTRIGLVVVDLDGGEAAQTMLDGIDAAGGVAVSVQDEAEARAELEAGEIGRLLIVPDDFSEGLDAGRTVEVQLISHPDADDRETEAVRLVVEGAARAMALESQILASLQQMGDMQADAANQEESFTTERIVAQARSQFESSQSRPLVVVAQRVPQASDTDMEELSAPVQLTVPGFTVLFVFLAAQTSARSIYDEKKIGSFRRLLAAPIGRTSMLTGKMVPNFIIGLLQTTVIFLFGIFAMPLFGQAPLSLGSYPWAVLAVVVIMALCSAALGVLIAAIARTENQIGGLSAVVLWAMGILGGSFVPAMILDRFLGPVPMVVPHYWANRAFNDLLVRGLRPSDVLLEIAALAGFTLLFFAIGVWQFDFD